MKKRIFAALLCLCMLAAMSPAIRVSAAGETYRKVSEPRDGKTYVFMAESIGTDSSFTNTADRLLRTGVFTGDTRDTATTQSTNFTRTDGETISVNSDGFAFKVIKAEGVVDGGNQGYRLQLTSGAASGTYLTVTQKIAYFEEQSLELSVDGVTIAGIAMPSQPFPSLGDESSAAVWYWDTAKSEFYTLYTTNLAAFGQIRTTNLGTKYYIATDENNKPYKVDWNTDNAYVDKSAFNGTEYQYSLSFARGADYKLRLVGSNPTNKTVDKDKYGYRNFAEIVCNPYYTVTKTKAMASLGLYTPEYYTASEVDSSLQWKSLSLYELQHEMIVYSRIEPTCTQDGREEHYYCRTCNAYYLDINETQWILGSSYATIPKLEHSLKKVSYKDSTCTAEGNIEYWECEREQCGACFEDENGTKEIERSSTIIAKKPHSGEAASYFAKAICDVCHNEYEDFAVDSTAPTGEIRVSDKTWNSFLDKITFELFFEDTQKVEITASDDSYNHRGFTEDKKAKIEYYLHNGDNALTQAELDKKTFTEYEGGFNINPDNKYVIYARITDHAGNVTYISSDGITLDASAPTEPTVDTNGYNSGEWLKEGNVSFTVSGSESLSGIAKYQYSTDNGASWTDMTITNDSASLVVSDETDGTSYLFRAVSNFGAESTASAPVTVKIDKTAPDGDIKFEENSVKKFINQISFGMFFNKNINVEITATDGLSGVAKIEFYRSDKALTEAEIAVITDWVETNGKFSVTAEDQAKFIYYVKITDEAGNITCFGSDGATFDLTVPEIGGIENGAIYYVTQELTVTDDNLNSVTLNGKPASGSVTLDGNRDETYTIIATDKAGNVTEYTVTMKTIESLGEPIKDLTTDNVTSDDKETVEAVKETVEALDIEDATEDEKAALKEITDKCDGLLEKIKEASEAIKTENIEKVKDITSDNVMPEDKEDLEAAKKDLEKALEDYGDNLTDEEKAAIEKEIENIDSALDSLEKAEAVEDTITKLPDTVKPGDTDTEQLINEAKEQYDALTEHEKSLVSKEAREKLESLLAALGDYKIVKGDGGKWEKGTKTGLSFTANGAYSKFTGIEVDGKAVDKDNYTAVSGSTVITLKAEYLETLSVGKHSLTVQYTDGKANGGFEILADTTIPGTGDNSNMMLWVVLLFVSGGVLTIAAVKNKKRVHKK